MNADDFGISEGVNRGIAEAHERGILTSATAMANMPAFDHAVQLWKEHSTLGVGVHLNLSTGAPVLPPSRVPSLVDESGRLLRLDRLMRALTLGRLDRRQLEAELAAQVERALAAGLSPTHLDSHHHVHTHPALHSLVVRIALRYGIRGLRCPVEMSPGDVVRKAPMLLASPKPSAVNPQLSQSRTQNPELRTQNSASVLVGEAPRGVYLKAATLSLLGWLLRIRARRAGLVVPDHFRGLLLGVAFSTERLLEELGRLPGGSTELMSHPGYPDQDLARRTSYSAGRDSELAALLAPGGRALLEKAGLRLRSYSYLSR